MQLATPTYLVDDIDATALVLDTAFKLLEAQAVSAASFVEAPHEPGICGVCVQEWMGEMAGAGRCS